MHLQCESITRIYGDRHILDGVSAEARPGKVTVLIGPNGAGKTTLFRILALLDPPDSGEILFSGSPVTGRPAAWRKHIAMVFQNPLLLDRTVKKNLRYATRSRGTAHKARIRDMAESLGLANLLDHNARQLSGGEKKRAALGMALMSEAGILLIDECFANLDPLSAKIFQDLLLSLKQSGRHTILLSTHNMVHARAFGDYIYFLHEGRIMEEGTPEEIFQTPASLFTARFVDLKNVFSAVIENDGAQTFACLENGKRISVITGLTGSVFLSIPPTDILVSKEPLSSSALNTHPGVILSVHRDGPLVTLSVDIGIPIEVAVTQHSVETLGLTGGQPINVTWKASSVHVFKDTHHLMGDDHEA